MSIPATSHTRSPGFTMNSVGMRSSFNENSDVSIERDIHKSKELAQEPKPLSTMSHDAINRENFRDSENEEAATMDNISSFLETMHSKNLTLKKLAKVQQQRIDELSRENKALRQASEMKDAEILRIQTQLCTLHQVPLHVDQLEMGDVPNSNQRESPSNKSIPYEHDQSTPQSSTTATNETGQPSQASAGQRYKPSIMVSHKVAVKRVMRLMRKINGAYNRKSVGLCTFVRGFAHIALPLLVSISRGTPAVLYVQCP